MNLKLEISLLVLGGILRILGVGWNIRYYFSQNFNSMLMKYLCGIFLVAPSVVFMAITLFIVFIDICKCRCSHIPIKLALGLLITLGGPIGAPLFVYAVLLAFNKSKTGDFHIIEGISKGTSLVEALFESLPQIVIQTMNNTENSMWREPLAIIPIAVSLICILWTLYKLCSAIDKVQQFEAASSMKINSEISGLNSTSGKKQSVEFITCT